MVHPQLSVTGWVSSSENTTAKACSLLKATPLTHCKNTSLIMRKRPSCRGGRAMHGDQHHSSASRIKTRRGCHQICGYEGKACHTVEMALYGQHEGHQTCNNRVPTGDLARAKGATLLLDYSVSQGCPIEHIHLQHSNARFLAKYVFMIQTHQVRN